MLNNKKKSETLIARKLASHLEYLDSYLTFYIKSISWSNRGIVNGYKSIAVQVKTSC
jgi:hypothetical protein